MPDAVASGERISAADEARRIVRRIAREAMQDLAERVAERDGYRIDEGHIDEIVAEMEG